MAESFVFSVAGSLIRKLASPAFQQASLAFGLDEHVRDLKNTLSIVNGVLVDAEKKQEQQHGLLEWLRQIKDVFTDAQDVLDDYECEVLRKQVIKEYGSTPNKVRQLFSSVSSLGFRRRIALDLEGIKERLDKVVADGAKFGLERIEWDNVDRRVLHVREMTYSHLNASDVVGRELDKENIIDLLFQIQTVADANVSLSVVPIVGIGGLGKTTLAKLVFNDARMDLHFPLKIWVCVSDDFDIKQLVIKIVNSACFSTGQESIRDMDMGQLQSHLKKRLAGQKFLLVLDDLWNEDYVKWIELIDLLKIGAKGSKILVTTRNNSIASKIGTVPSYELKGLVYEESLSIFVRWAFKEGEEKLHPNLVEIGKEIVKKCKGVPLAVRTVACSLFCKVDEEEWRFVRDNEIWKLKQQEKDILPALKLSYDRMPFYLKQCFAFFALYPKDFEFESIYVTELWVALGLLQLSDGTSKLEDVAKQYLFELHSRSFLEDFTCCGGYFYSFKMHDLVHDLAVYVANDEFFMVDSHRKSIPEKARYLSIAENDLIGKHRRNSGGQLWCHTRKTFQKVRELPHSQTDLPCLAFFPESKCVRTIMFPVEGLGANSDVLLNLWLSRYKYLRVLDLSDSSFWNLPQSIGNLRLLRYLDLSYNFRIRSLPDSICELQSLQTLLLKRCERIKTLPKGLKKLINLRQLVITTEQSILPQNEIANLTRLQILTFEHCYYLKSVFKGVKLTSLKELGIHYCWYLKSLPFCLQNLPELVALSITYCENLELSQGYDEPCTRLKLKTVRFGNLNQLVTLPKWLEGAADTLHTMIVANCKKLESLPDWLATSAHLNTLRILSCPRLWSLPNDMKGFPALETLEFDSLSELGRKREYQIGGEYWPHISHIKTVISRDAW